MCNSSRPRRSEPARVPTPQPLRNPFLDNLSLGSSGSQVRLGRSSLRIPLQAQPSTSGGGAVDASAGDSTATARAAGEDFIAPTFGARDRNRRRKNSNSSSSGSSTRQIRFNDNDNRR